MAAILFFALAACASEAAQLVRRQSYRRDADAVYTVDDGPGFGLTWEGVGAISGGGATTKLLYDYPDDVAGKILDLLFKPGLGLSLQMLKVEIGGDTDATEGAEPSHMHFDGDENFNRGYEWWLMKEAKKRNPDIKLYALPWGWPGALDPQASSFVQSLNSFVNVSKTVDYTLSWILGAKRVHGLDIDYVGLWNEKDAPPEYRLALQAAVANSEVGSRTKVLDRLVHYPGSTNSPDQHGCQHHRQYTEPGANWADEEGSMFDGRSARCLARVLNRNYISLCKTATFQWHLISSFYDYLPWPRCGVAVANEPWSGAFEITSPLWAIAHTTQFAPIGWRYAAHDAGVSMLRMGGSMVTRVSPDVTDFSIVLEKIDSQTSVCGHGRNPPAEVFGEDVVIQLAGSFLKAVVEGGKKLRVWRSNLRSSSDYGVNPPDAELFQQLGPLDVAADGTVRLRVEPEELYTLTTLEIGQKGAVESPPRQDFPIPYQQSFNEEGIGRPPRLWYDQMGAWEVQQSPYGDARERGNVMRQVVPVWPNCWGYSCEPPVTYFGPATFRGDLTVSFDARVEGNGGFAINPVGLNYSTLVLKTDGTWSLGRKSGTLDFAADTWHRVTMRMLPDGSQLAQVNGVSLKGPASFMSFRGTTKREQCDESTFPLSTRGKKHRGLKSDGADTPELCRRACCADENLCDVWQFDEAAGKCEIGRFAEGYEKDLQHRWVGGTRGELTGWHLKIRLLRYIHVSIDNFQLYETDLGAPTS